VLREHERRVQRTVKKFEDLSPSGHCSNHRLINRSNGSGEDFSDNTVGLS
jgi:hypothetical protein